MRRLVVFLSLISLTAFADRVGEGNNTNGQQPFDSSFFNRRMQRDMFDSNDRERIGLNKEMREIENELQTVANQRRQLMDRDVAQLMTKYRQARAQAEERVTPSGGFVKAGGVFASAFMSVVESLSEVNPRTLTSLKSPIYALAMKYVSEGARAGHFVGPTKAFGGCNQNGAEACSYFTQLESAYSGFNLPTDPQKRRDYMSRLSSTLTTLVPCFPKSGDTTPIATTVQNFRTMITGDNGLLSAERRIPTGNYTLQCPNGQPVAGAQVPL